MMKVREIMTRKPEYINPEITLKDAADKMKDMDIGALPVGENDRLVGMITDRDITVRAVADGMNPTEKKVRDIMSEGVIYVKEDQTIEEAASLMKENRIRRLVVLNDDKRMVGFCSLGDLATDTADRKVKSETIEEVSKPSEPDRS